MPASPSPFIGRASELAQLDTLLAQPATHLITILGAGGMGKTQLALQVAKDLTGFQNLSGLYRDGVFFVPLAPLTSSRFIVSAIANAIGCALQAGSEPKQ